MQLRCTQSCSQLAQWEKCHPLSGLSVTLSPWDGEVGCSLPIFSLFFPGEGPTTLLPLLRGRHPTFNLLLLMATGSILDSPSHVCGTVKPLISQIGKDLRTQVGFPLVTRLPICMAHHRITVHQSLVVPQTQIIIDRWEGYVDVLDMRAREHIVLIFAV
ncbi:hypothetical protein BDV37DRAFT_256053 [Aspergillus pseudonomiae]|uniref:Uncharacterized protein n=1 Tax=Aspergillus pseudonomiae TaxID=1506151 RepID=A0A5N7D576_9EURO|nr:uncharacterized protein BDV37DRAFT_256053 [Aspergillus pseudonomiae]KAE8401053.1 hypothetical protein BDV37DRAFT_256053 [Aspergillus pseudonomiae]